jgi:hypothetical protein
MEEAKDVDSKRERANPELVVCDEPIAQETGYRRGKGLHFMKQFTLIATVVMAAFAAAAQTEPDKHSITVKFDYDFTKTPACSPTVTKKCVKQFNIYDTSAGYKKRTKLFSIPAPAGETKSVQGITGTSPRLVFESGKHRIAAAAETAEGVESNLRLSVTWAEVP